MEVPMAITIYRCPQCGSNELSLYVKCWVDFPEREVHPEDVDECDAIGDEDAICRRCQHMFDLGKALIVHDETYENLAMTFAEFQGTRAWCDDLGEKLKDDSFDPDTPQKGWIYCDALYIEDTRAWTVGTCKHGEGDRWYLLLNRDEWLSNNLEELERRLYVWALSEGYGIKEDA
jgi:hypothetical protein